MEASLSGSSFGTTAFHAARRRAYCSGVLRFARSVHSLRCLNARVGALRLVQTSSTARPRLNGLSSSIGSAVLAPAWFNISRAAARAPPAPHPPPLHFFPVLVLSCCCCVVSTPSGERIVPVNVVASGFAASLRRCPAARYRLRRSDGRRRRRTPHLRDRRGLVPSLSADSRSSSRSRRRARVSLRGVTRPRIRLLSKQKDKKKVGARGAECAGVTPP
jgi:hypothetical protein